MNIKQLALSEQELQRRATEYRTALADEEQLLTSLLIFSLGKQWYGCSVEQLQQTLPIQHIVRLPYMHPAVSGLTNLRGTLLLTFDLRRFLGISVDTPPEIIMVAQKGSLLTGLLVEEIKGVEEIPQTDFQSQIETASGISPEFIQGVSIVYNEPLLWLDIHKIITGLEGVLG